MKIIYIRFKTMLIALIAILAILALIIFFSFNFTTKTKDIFNNDDVYYKGTIDEKIIAFACNVDWGNECIPGMLDIFRESDIKITFFVTGRWAEKNPELLKTIYENGHEIGNHGYFHRDYNTLNYEDNKKEIQKADLIISEILGIKSKYFAPPSGAYNDYTVRAATDLEYKLIMWSIDTIDWRNDSTKDKIINRVIGKHHNSAIVLMHPKEETVKALPVIIQNLKDKGYKIGSISDIIK
ncbi:polysaccharide deacetylase family protein [Proteiniborus sp. MB09-C3]|uniref:polysaccharide deacetylase family protein n=1 Tax=Proteiniborus sp. MB09-C3 TaxID=3050072 RepID=UPI0025529BA2|nr:polysaccharide deacetylase family protein [Proteiniborus sp. MB09-C3]WIV10909.1 polysaccharide deacetylase family protein [Proteiniborus sp. MB09-C3]